MSKTFLAMLASLALTATLEVGYFVYLKNTITPTRVSHQGYYQRRIYTSLSESAMTSSPFMGLISIIELS